MPEIAFHPNHANRCEQLAELCEHGFVEGWSCKKKAKEGDLYVFYFGLPKASVTAVGVSQGDVEEEEGPFDWTSRGKQWFCTFDPLIALDVPVTKREIETDPILKNWWSGRPFQGSTKAIRKRDHANRLLYLILRNNPRSVRLHDLFSEYLEEVPKVVASRAVRTATLEAVLGDLPEGLDIGDPPPTVESVVQRRIRDSIQARELKRHYCHECQVCEEVTPIPGGEDKRYAEVHHLRPLGNGHEGRDHWQNMIVLCPTCHAEFDLLAMGVHPKSLRVHTFADEHPHKGNTLIVLAGHGLASENIAYHWELFQQAAKHKGH